MLTFSSRISSCSSQRLLTWGVIGGVKTWGLTLAQMGLDVRLVCPILWRSPNWAGETDRLSPLLMGDKEEELLWWWWWCSLDRDTPRCGGLLDRDTIGPFVLRLVDRVLDWVVLIVIVGMPLLGRTDTVGGGGSEANRRVLQISNSLNCHF